MTNPSKRSPRRFVSEPYSGEGPDPLSRPRGTAGENEKSALAGRVVPTQSQGEEPAETGSEETTDERTAVQAALDEWGKAKLERELMRMLDAQIAELNRLMAEWRRRR